MGGERAHRCTLLRLSRNGKRLTDKLVEVSERGCLKAVLRRAQGGAHRKGRVGKKGPTAGRSRSEFAIPLLTGQRAEERWESVRCFGA